MRRYDVARQQLLDLIGAEKSNWIGRARTRTSEYKQARAYTGGSEFWGEIKGVYIRLQHEKCAYCETKLQGAALASKVHEVEHFRPKSSVQAWPPSKRPDYLSDFAPSWSLGPDSDTGYYCLAYHPFNYAIACTRCNSTLKSNFFPVRGPRDVNGEDPSHMQVEEALLVYPISDIDEDPARIITFHGVTAMPAQSSGYAYERAVTTIRFFQLNHEDLTTRRAALLMPLWLNLEDLAQDAGGGNSQPKQRAVDRACDARSEFSRCMEAFRSLHQTDSAEAKRLAEFAETLTGG